MSVSVVSPAGERRPLGAVVGAAVGALLVRPRPAWTLALMRIIYGLTLLAWTVTSMFDADDLLAPDGLVAPEFAATDRWRYLALSTSAGVWIALGVLALVAIAVTVGFRPTGWLVLAFVLLVAIQRRDPLILNSGDLILRNLALLLALCPTGAALSVDRWRSAGRAALRSAPCVAPWGLRLVQLQVVVVYFFAFWSKSGSTWREGTAVSTALRLEDLRRFAPPGWMIDDVVVVAMLTWGALAIELALALLLWVRPLRHTLVVAGLVMHVFIDTFMLVGFFLPVMTVGLVAFLDPDAVGRAVDRLLRPRRPPHEPGFTPPDGANPVG